jgi:hypothetical protein
MILAEYRVRATWIATLDSGRRSTGYASTEAELLELVCDELSGVHVQHRLTLKNK